MDKSTGKTYDAALEQKIPFWTCELSAPKNETVTVGDIRTLKCSGFDFVSVGKDYRIKLEEKDAHFLKILSVRVDGQSVKNFEVTSYVAGKSDLKIDLEASGETIFTSVVKGVEIQSVIKNPTGSKVVPPYFGYYILPGAVEMFFMAVLFLSVLAVFLLKFVNKVKQRNQFKRIVSKARYADPFMDFNIEVRDYSRQKKDSSLFLNLLDDSIKKVFFRVFNDDVSLEDLNGLEKNLKCLGMEPHEIRGFHVLGEEYKKFQNIYRVRKGDALTEKKEFLDQAKKTVNKLKNYVEVAS